MLSDHPELTLAAIRETNSDDPRKFGLALGNLRYFLAEVLKGLAYMHSLHILHRDVKSSNILIRFHCNHDNLIWCTCTHKYTVCVCDFDAAVEMDENDRMLPVSSTSQVSYLTLLPASIFMHDTYTSFICCDWSCHSIVFTRIFWLYEYFKIFKLIEL